MQQSEYMAMMQGDDGALGNAELVAAYEQGIDEIRTPSDSCTICVSSADNEDHPFDRGLKKTVHDANAS
jgi:hypothetical protein